MISKEGGYWLTRQVTMASGLIHCGLKGLDFRSGMHVRTIISICTKESSRGIYLETRLPEIVDIFLGQVKGVYIIVPD